jgi:hypothetical protein
LTVFKDLAAPDATRLSSGYRPIETSPLERAGAAEGPSLLELVHALGKEEIRVHFVARKIQSIDG